MATSAATYIANHLPSMGVAERFEVIRTGMNHNNSPFLRMAQLHDGVPVFGAEVVVHSNGAQFSTANGQVLPGLRGLKTRPSLAKDRALSIAKEAYSSGRVDRVSALEFSREQTQLVILPIEGEAPRLAWHTSFYTELQAGLDPAHMSYFVDAHTGEILKKFNNIHTLSQASGPGGNAKVPRTWTNALDVEPSGTQFMMDTARLRTTNMNNGTAGQGTIVVGPLSNIGDAPINDAHGFAEATLNMLLDWQGENSINGNGFKIISRVHYSSNYENAFWDGSQMTYGDGASTFYPLSGGLDVVSHEVNHGYTSFHSNLVYSGQSGGMNESFSDIAGEVAESYLDQAAPDMLVGADIFKSPTGALRYMCNPTQDGRSIDNIANYRSGIDVHLSSGIQNKAFCRSAARLASGSPTGAPTMASVRRVSNAFWLANKQIWTSGSTFQQGCQGVWDAATQLGFTAAEKCAIRDSFIDVGLTCGDATVCGGPPPPPPPPPGNSYSYSATNTNSAQQNTVNHVVALNAGDVVTLGTCGVTGSAFTGDTWLRVNNPSGTQVASNDDACGGRGSQATFTAAVAGNYTIRGGCYAAGSCTGTVAWTVAGGPPPPPPPPPGNGSYNYSASNTSSATRNTVNQSVTLGAGQRITVATCGATGSTFTGDTYLRLYGPAASQVAANDDACGGLGSSITYTATTAGSYQIRGGCYANTACTATAVWTIQ
ncbi:MAG: M4 family metallopeptidase [Kofleriaceae bacterium]